MSETPYPRFPKDFLFGTANADHQVEAHDPEREDVWDLWERCQGLTPRGKATDFANRYEEDTAPRTSPFHSGVEMFSHYKIKTSQLEGIYAVFKVEEDSGILSGKPESAKIWPLIQRKAQEKSYRTLNQNRSADPVVLSLRSILDALAKNK